LFISIRSKKSDALHIIELQNRIKEITKYLYYYIEFKKELDSSIDNDNKIFIDLSYIKFLKDNEFKKEDDGTLAALWMFNANLYLAQLDEGYVCNRETLLDLISFSTKLKNWIEETRSEPDLNIKTITYQKFRFLILKILLRFEKTLHKELVRTNESKYNSTNLDKEIEVKYSIKDIVEDDKNDKIKNIFIGKYYKDIKKIYPDKPEEELRISTPNIYHEIQGIIKKADDAVTIYDIHFLFKVAKYNTKEIRIEKNKNILSFLEKLEIFYNDKCHENQKINKYSNFTALNLIRNTLIRVYLNEKIEIIEKSKDAKEIKEIIEGIVSIIEDKADYFKNNEEDVNNISSNKFNPAFQFGTIIGETCKRILILLRDKIIDDIDIYHQDFQKLSLLIRILISKTITHLDNCIESIEEAEEKKVLPIYLSLRECFLDKKNVSLDKQNNKIEEVSIFADSAYVLPSNYKSLYKCIRGKHISRIRNLEFEFYNAVNNEQNNKNKNEIQRKLEEYKLKNKEDLDNSIKDNKVNFDKLIKDNQINAIQLVGLYAGFITFVLGSIKIVPEFITSKSDILLFLLVFASSLCLFVFLIRFLFDQDTSPKNWKELIGYYKETVGENTTKRFHKNIVAIVFFVITFLGSLSILFIEKIPLLFKGKSKKIIINTQNTTIKTKDSIYKYYKKDSTAFYYKDSCEIN
jgi:hypothetical protein